jgi:cardiolipin synthase
LGGILDPVADKLMLATVFVVMALLGVVPLWLTTAVIARDCIIVLGAISYRVLVGPVEARPTFISKLNTLCQVSFVLAIVSRLQFGRPPAELVLILGAALYTTVVISGIDYVLVYGRMAAEAFRARHQMPRTGGPKAV